MTFLTGFSKRKAIKIATAGIPASDLAAFSKLFKVVGDTDIGAELTSQKMAVTLADGTTQVPYAALSWANVSGAVNTILRAKFDLDHTWSNGQTIGYLYYDHTATDQSNKSGVLDSYTVGYWPLEEDPSGSAPQMKDWSGNANDGTSSGSMVSGDLINGAVGKGLNFDGIAKGIDVGEPAFSNNDAFSVSFWVNATSWDNNACIISKGDAGVWSEWAAWIINSGTPTLNCLVGQTASSWKLTNNCQDTGMSTGVWYHYYFVADGVGNFYIYRNGSQAAHFLAADGTRYKDANNVKLGRGASGFYFNGKVDELFIASSGRSADWIAYDYTDQFSNSTTFTLGVEEVSGGSGSTTGEGNISTSVQLVASSVKSVIAHITDSKSLLASSNRSASVTLSSLASKITSSLRAGVIHIQTSVSTIIGGGGNSEASAGASATLVASSVKTVQSLSRAFASIISSCIRTGSSGVGASAIAQITPSRIRKRIVVDRPNERIIIDSPHERKTLDLDQ